MKHFRPLLLLIPILLAGCSTLTSHERAVLQQQQVSPYVYNKMMDGDPLTLPDIIELSHHAVPPGIIIDYLQQTDARYRLQKSDVKRLRGAGVDESVISYLLSTSPPYPGPYAGGPYNPYGPGYYAYGPAWDYGYYGGPYGYYGGPAIYVGGGYYHHGWYGGGWHHYH